MKFSKSTLCGLALTGLLLLQTNLANAAGIGYIDLPKILKEYNYAQQISNDVNQRNIDLQKFMTDANQKINDAKTPVDKKNLEQKYSSEFKSKLTSFQDFQAVKQTEIENNILDAVKSVASDQKLDAVFASGVLLYGGTDISSSVINKLNKK